MNPKKRADLVLHPVRLRILSLLGTRSLTAGQMAAMLPDIPQATLYRQLKALEEAEFITIIDSRPVRGTVEKVYGLEPSSPVHFESRHVREFSKEDHQKYFSAFLGSLFSSFINVTDHLEEHPEFLERLGYRSRSLRIPENSLPQFQKDYLALLEKYNALAEESGEVYQLSTVLIPEVNYES